jgi:glyoxylase-like metal-dependent hydrolase (beta-lactamase superfamily II)
MANLDVLTYGFTISTNQGGMGFSSITLLTTASRRILIDTGPASRRALLHEALKSRGLEYGDIDTVLLTHLHWDHCQNTDLFTNARILVGRGELAYAKNPARGDYSAAWYIADMMDKMKAETVSEGDRIADGVSIIETPGHTIGHISVVLDVDDHKVLVTGDALPDSGTVVRGKPYNIFWDENDAQASVEKMVHTSHTFYPGHDMPFHVHDGEIDYLHPPVNLEISTSNEAGHPKSITYKVFGKQPINHNPLQKGC